MVRPYIENDARSLADLKQYFPDVKPPAAPGTFELALSVAGGTSTGAYIAGVLDFLVEALDAYATAQAINPLNTPKHKVRVVNFTGTSAGGLSVGLASIYTLRQFPHVYDDDKWAKLVAAGLATGVQNPQLSPLYRAWVQEIDLSKLLAPPPPGDTNISIFYAAPADVRTTVFALVKQQPVRPWPAWAAQPLDLRLTVGNLRGVPYTLTFDNVAVPVDGERLTLHRDHVAFSVSNGGVQGAPDTHDLIGATFDADPAWTLFGSTAEASSAIPVVFAPVSVMGQDPVAYQWRDCYFDSALNLPVLDEPYWLNTPTPYNFTSTDGGVFDDAPFEVAHRVLAGVNGVNSRDGATANRAVILIAPIINEAQGDPQDPVLPPPDGPATTATPLGKLLNAIVRLVLSPIEQCRLSSFDLSLIKSENVFSRYMISPSRENPNPAKQGAMLGPSKSLMSLPLLAVLGFAAQAYRRHDFLLGRRNAQNFLSSQFMLPLGNPLIDPAAPWEPSDLRIAPDPVTGNPTTFYPIIPLRGAVHQSIQEPLPDWNWEALTNDMLNNFVSMFGVRADDAWNKIKASLMAAKPGASFWAGLGSTLANTFFVGPVAWAAWTFNLRPSVVNGFKTALTNAKASLDPSQM